MTVEADEVRRTSTENYLSYWWMRDIYSKLPYQYRKNLKGSPHFSLYRCFFSRRQVKVAFDDFLTHLY
jgi:hypothetical protein